MVPLPDGKYKALAENGQSEHAVKATVKPAAEPAAALGPEITKGPPLARADSEEVCCLYCTDPASPEHGFIPASPCLCKGALAAYHTECLRADLLRNWRLRCSVCRSEFTYEREVIQHSVLRRIRVGLKLRELQLVLIIGGLSWLLLHALQTDTVANYHRRISRGDDKEQARHDAILVLGWSGFAKSLLVTFCCFFALLKISATAYCTVVVKLLAAAPVHDAGGVQRDGASTAEASGSGDLEACAPPQPALPIVLLEFGYEVTPDMRSRKTYPRALVAFDRAMRLNAKRESAAAAQASRANPEAVAEPAEAADIELGVVAESTIDIMPAGVAPSTRGAPVVAGAGGATPAAPTAAIVSTTRERSGATMNPTSSDQLAATPPPSQPS